MHWVIKILVGFLALTIFPSGFLHLLPSSLLGFPLELYRNSNLFVILFPLGFITGFVSLTGFVLMLAGNAQARRWNYVAAWLVLSFTLVLAIVFGYFQLIQIAFLIATTAIIFLILSERMHKAW